MKVKKWLLGLVTFAAMVVICAVCAGAETYGDFEYRVLDDGGLTEVRLLTGRTHQIRASFAAAGHPLCGDVRYGAQKNGEKDFQDLRAKK